MAGDGNAQSVRQGSAGADNDDGVGLGVENESVVQQTAFGKVAVDAGRVGVTSVNLSALYPIVLTVSRKVRVHLHPRL